jgi:hypothetical protein
MYKRGVVACLLCICSLGTFALPASIAGVIVEIAGQRLTIVDATGARVTFAVSTVPALLVGERVRIDYITADDAKHATSITKLTK